MGRTRFSRRWLASFVGVGLVAGLIRAETSPPAQEDPIAAAKRDYEAIKATRTGSTQAAPARVSPSVPPLNLGNDDAPVLSPIQRARKDEASATTPETSRSKNWLVDAMAKDHDATLEPQSRAGAALHSDSKRLQYSDLENRKERESLAHGRSMSAVRADRGKIKDAPNPLTPYLAGWMTRQDYELLQPRSKNTGAVGVRGEPGVSSFPIDSANKMPAPIEESASVPPATNPYLPMPVRSPVILPHPSIQVPAATPTSAPQTDRTRTLTKDSDATPTAVPFKPDDSNRAFPPRKRF